MWRRHLLCSVLLALACATMASPTTIDNDDSCDISALPAATLLLPYFEVDLSSTLGENTLFTVTNVTHLPQIARVTIWTDLAFPVFSFTVFLTGYDVEPINLRDVLGTGFIRSPHGSDEGQRSADNDGNPLLNVRHCGDLPNSIHPVVVGLLQAALTTGSAAGLGCSAAPVGLPHANAIGFVTVDVVDDCGGRLPTEQGYFTDDVLYDNVLVGDYQHVNELEELAQAGTMVHIRAIPEGGPPGGGSTSLDRTFYSRLLGGDTLDRRQPLPSTFAARWIGDAPGELATDFKIWRQGLTDASADCEVSANGENQTVELVRFDENENPTVATQCVGCAGQAARLPATARVHASDTDVFPPASGGDPAGWMYMNLDDRNSATPFAASQAWVIVSMRAQNRFAVDFDAVALGNGCSDAVAPTNANGGAPAIGPPPNVPSSIARGVAPSTQNNDDSCDISLLPAATLLLPYFDVNPREIGRTTLFTVTNVTPLPRIARVTIWTDFSYPPFTFSLFLTGYDVQAINLFDLIVSGSIAPPAGTTSDENEHPPGVRSAHNDANPMLDLRLCDNLEVDIPSPVRELIARGLITGRIDGCGTARVGNEQPDGHARGYVTVDVVSNCDATLFPTDPRYFTTDLLFDNALIGDYQQLYAENNFAQGGTMVHIRAVPEGVASGNESSGLARTFYGRYQTGSPLDRRQPLPSTFAGRWISGGADALHTSLNTSFKIWREGITDAASGCNVFANRENAVADLVRFDEDENPSVYVPDVIIDPGPPLIPDPKTSSTSQISVADTTFFPPNPGHDLGGWMYLNLTNDRGPAVGGSQAWVIVSTAAQRRFSGDFDAVALGNGCSPPTPVTDEDGDEPRIAPAPNDNGGS